MNTRSLYLVAFLVVAASAGPSDAKPPAYAGWYDLFPPCQKHFHPMYDAPVIEKDKDRVTGYSQTVHFDFMTNLPRSFRVTVARDPAFKTQYGTEAMKKAKADSFEVGKKREGWVWADKKKVVVPLGDDKAVILETDPYSEHMPIVEYAKSMDYDRIEKALAKPPRSDFAVSLETFTSFKKGDTALGLHDWAGPAKSLEQIGMKEDERVRWTYVLKDKSKVLVITTALKIDSIVHEAGDGSSVDLLK